MHIASNCEKMKRASVFTSLLHT